MTVPDMSSRSSDAPEIGAFVKRAVGFTLLLVAAYVLVLFVAVNTVPGGIPGLGYTNVPAESPTRGGPSWFTHREVGEHTDLDIVWVGSSHAYRTFDPRFFDRYGVRTFNLGSTAQTPLNTYYVLRDHLDRLRPRVVVFEMYWTTLEWDGTESALDLISNFDPTRNLARMAVATRDIRIVNAYLRRLFDVRDRPDPEPNLWEGDTYIGRGFVEKAADFEASRRWDLDSIRVSPRQLDYLDRTISLILDAGVDIVVIVQPLPPHALAAIGNRAEIDAALQDLASGRRVPYIDFNESMVLDSARHFFDAHHLNQAGLAEFLPVLLDRLVNLGVVNTADGR